MVVPVNILLFPAENIVLVPSLATNSCTASMPLLLPSTEVPLEDTADQPLRAPTLPYWSITQLSAIAAKDGLSPIGESIVFSPKNPGAATVMFCSFCAI